MLFLSNHSQQIETSHMNKTIHILILAALSFTCLFMWSMLRMTGQIFVSQTEVSQISLPAFSELCVSFSPVFFALPAIALAYCIWILIRRSSERDSWYGFFAASTSGFMVLAMPAMSNLVSQDCPEP